MFLIITTIYGNMIKSNIAGLFYKNKYFVIKNKKPLVFLLFIVFKRGD
ncbi:hypothetical protein Pf1_01327 [Flavobacterium columnare]|nr:hypothetical protein Pf1_01327 [Flavobacterium columnare]